MKKNISLLCASVVFVSMMPTTAFAATLTRGNCNTLVGPKKTACLRRMERQDQTTNAKQWRDENSDIARQARSMRRGDTSSISGSQKSIEAVRKERMQMLQTQRIQTQNNAQKRYEERKTRQEEQKTERLNKLKQRYGSTVQSVQSEKSTLRSRSQQLHDRSQIRRDAILQAHEECKSIGVGQRLQCLQEAREGALE